MKLWVPIWIVSVLVMHYVQCWSSNGPVKVDQKMAFFLFETIFGVFNISFEKPGLKTFFCSWEISSKLQVSLLRLVQKPKNKINNCWETQFRVQNWYWKPVNWEAEFPVYFNRPIYMYLGSCFECYHHVTNPHITMSWY